MAYILGIEVDRREGRVLVIDSDGKTHEVSVAAHDDPSQWIAFKAQFDEPPPEGKS